MNYFNKQKIIDSVKSFWGEAINPRRDWIIIVTVFIILVISVCLINYKIFLETNSKELFIDISKESIVIRKVKDKDMQALITRFEEKKSQFNSIKFTRLIDPSL